MDFQWKFMGSEIPPLLPLRFTPHHKMCPCVPRICRLQFHSPPCSQFSVPSRYRQHQSLSSVCRILGDSVYVILLKMWGKGQWGWGKNGNSRPSHNGPNPETLLIFTWKPQSHQGPVLSRHPISWWDSVSPWPKSCPQFPSHSRYLLIPDSGIFPQQRGLTIPLFSIFNCSSSASTQVFCQMKSLVCRRNACLGGRHSCTLLWF